LAVAIDAPVYLTKIHCPEIVMRPKFVISFLLFAVAVFGAIFLLKPKPAAPSAPTSAETTATAPTATAPAPAKQSLSPEIATPAKPVEEAVAAVLKTAPASNPPPASAAATSVALTVEERAAAIEKLQDWGTHDAKDTEALTNIVAALASPDEKIREAAIDATRELASKDAIPALTDAAARTTDHNEKKALLDAVEFLKLPLLGTPEANQDAPAENVKPELPAADPAKP
jgi:hypothetical protein